MMISIIVPVLNESQSIRQLVREIENQIGQSNLDVELLFVDDGSTDDSWEIITNLSRVNSAVRGIRFRRNFGKAAALSAGFNASNAQIVITMDADLQDDPAEIPKLLTKLEEGYDVVNGWKKQRLDPWHKVYPSKVFNFLVSVLTGVKLHDHNCGLKCFRAEVARSIDLYGELHRFIPVLAHAQGFRVTELGVHHRSRKFGRSKYGARRFLRGFLDLLTVKFLTGFGQRPQHILGGMGLASFSFGSLGLLYLATLWVLNQFGMDFGPIGIRPFLAYSVALTLLGGQLMSLGFIADLIVSNGSKTGKYYSISETTGVISPMRGKKQNMESVQLSAGSITRVV